MDTHVALISGALALALLAYCIRQQAWVPNAALGIGFAVIGLVLIAHGSDYAAGIIYLGGAGLNGGLCWWRLKK